MKIPEIFGCQYSHAKQVETLFGVELEIESVNRSIGWKGFRADEIEMKDDNSLRNYGKEFITRPENLKTTLEFFKNVHDTVGFLKPEEKFSERTSIHVHVNCQNLEGEQVRQAVLLYALFEEVFFKMVEPSRRDNIHCVPLTDTYLPSYFRSSIGTLVGRWSKYTALNLLPLKTLGTMEFRHMHGHDDPLLLEDWLMSIENLIELAKTQPLTDTTLIEENIQTWFTQIFGKTLFWKQNKVNLPVFTENTLINVKMGFL